MKAFLQGREIAILLLLFLLFSFCFFFANQEHLIVVNDTMTYVTPAENLLAGHGFLNGSGKADTSRTPGYPLFLCLVFLLGGGLREIVFLQIFLSALSIYLCYRICRLLRLRESMALLCTGAYLLNLSTYIYQSYVVSDLFFYDMLTIALFFLVKYIKEKRISSFIGFTVLLNFALWVRPITIYFNLLVAAVLIVLLLFKKLPLKEVLCYMVCFALMIGGWCARNYRVSGVFEYSSIRNLNLMYYDASGLRGEIDGISFEKAQELFEQEFNTEYGDAVDGLSEAQVRQLYGKIGSRYIKAHFGRYLIKNVRGLFLEFFGPNSSFLKTTIPNRGLRLAVTALYEIYLAAVYVLYAIGFLKNIRRLSLTDWFIFLLSGYLAAASASLGYARFRVAWFGLIVLGGFLLTGEKEEQADHEA